MSNYLDHLLWSWFVVVVFERRLPTVNLSELDDAGISHLQQQLREKELRLTDVRLEALTSAHRLHQMQDAVKRLKASLMTHNYNVVYMTVTMIDPRIGSQCKTVAATYRLSVDGRDRRTDGRTDTSLTHTL